MPEGQIAGLLPYYGYILFSIIAILYCKFIEKRSLQDIGLTKQGTDYLLGIGIAVVMLVLVVILCLVTGSVSFWGINRDVNITINRIGFNNRYITRLDKIAFIHKIQLDSINGVRIETFKVKSAFRFLLLLQ